MPVFWKNPEALQAEAFGNGSLFVIAADVAQAERIAESLEGNLTGCIYSATDGSDDTIYDQIAPALRTKVGRLLDDKMPTGVAVSPAMNHGGPFSSNGTPGLHCRGHASVNLPIFDAAIVRRNPFSSIARQPV